MSHANALAIDGEATTVSLIRQAPDTYDEGGRLVSGAETSQAIQAAVQPAAGRALEDLPEGVRREARLFIWSRSLIREDATATGCSSRGTA
jgi:hypothetical protein